MSGAQLIAEEACADIESSPAHDLELKTVDSPLLRRLGLKDDTDGEGAGIKAGDWVRTRVRQNQDKPKEEGSKEKEVLAGVKVKYYD